MDLNPPPPSSSLSSGFSNFPILAIALLAIMVTGLLLVTYYIVVIKCCLNWQSQLPPPLRPRGARGPRVDASSSWLAFSSPTNNNRGLDELVLRDIPTLKYKAKSSRFGSSKRIGERSFRGCAVCLSGFEDQEMLRVLPHCGHVFHLDCIDVWLLNNANCPLCRSTITGAAPKRAPLDHIVAPSSSPQEIIPIDNTETTTTRGSDGNKGRIRNLHGSIMGDECIVRDEEFLNGGDQPIRRSFSMDSVTDRRLLLQVQQIIRQNRLISNEGSASSSGNRSIRRSFFSFGQGQGSKTSILPIQSDI
ncbi:hypothetical protein V2J09_022130 [Rumex salicifolius]